MPASKLDPVIYITSFPGTGKLTIARHLTAYLTAQNITSHLLDNHSLIEPVANKYARTHPAYQSERKKERQKALKRWVEGDEGRGKWVVCTGTSLAQNSRMVEDAGDGVASEYLVAAQNAGRVFVPIYLVCQEEENLRRAASEERKGSGTTKLVDREEMKRIRAEYSIYSFGIEEELKLDVTNMSAQDAAAEIFKWTLRCSGPHAPQ